MRTVCLSPALAYPLAVLNVGTPLTHTRSRSLRPSLTSLQGLPAPTTFVAYFKMLPLLWSPRGVRALIAAAMLTLLHQFSGESMAATNGVMMLTNAGLSTKDARMGMVIFGLLHLTGMFIALLVINRVKRRNLLLFGAFACAVCNVASAITYSVVKTPPWVRAGTVLAQVLVFQIGIASTFWVITTELFPADLRALGMSAAYMGVNFLCLLLSFVYPPLVTAGSQWSWFVTVSVTCTASAIGCVFLVPETSGVGDLDNVENMLWTPRGSIKLDSRVVRKSS